MIDLRLGDCLDILPTLADKSVDAIITDVPYGTTACKWDVIIPLDKMWEQVKRLCKGAFVTTASQPFTSVLIMSNLDWFKYEWVYRKTKATNFLNAQKNPLKYHENVLMFSQNGHTYNPQMEDGEPYKKVHRNDNKDDCTYGKSTRKNGDIFINGGTRYPSSILKPISNPSGRGQLHPTQKPVALYEYLIRTYTNEGDTVLDFCFGSCTTGIACLNTNRNFIGIEKQADYFAIAERRIQEAQQQMVTV